MSVFLSTVSCVKNVFITYKLLRLGGLSLSRAVNVLVVGRKEMLYLTTHSTHFIYGYMASDIWLRTILIVRKETRCSTWATLSD